MDHAQWQVVVRSIRQALRGFPRPRRRTRYSDFLILAMYFWSVTHDRAMMWACDRSHYHSMFRPRRLPSVSQFHRRVRGPRIRQLLQRVNDLLVEQDVAPQPDAPRVEARHVGRDLLIVDGKPLLVSSVSKDPDARVGHVQGGFAKGYKLHAFVTAGGTVVCWCVRPLNEHEMPLAIAMLHHMPPMTERSLLLADGNYDAHDFHKAVAARGGRLLCELRGRARHPVTLRQMGRARRELLRVAERMPSTARMVLSQRRTIEARFGHLTSMGLGALPHFVRRQGRVQCWTGAKLALYHARRQARRAHGNPRESAAATLD